MSAWVRLGAEQVIKIHDQIHPCPVRDRGLLHIAVDKPWTSFLGQEQYPKLMDKVAALLHGIARNHPFMDGNKRTALHASLILGRLNGVEILLPSDEAVAAFVEDVARGRLEHAASVSWFAAKARQI